MTTRAFSNRNRQFALNVAWRLREGLERINAEAAQIGQQTQCPASEAQEWYRQVIAIIEDGMADYQVNVPRRKP